MPDTLWPMREGKRAVLRVLIPQSGSLFDEGLKSLIRRDDGLQILTATAGDAATFFAEVTRLSPEVILLNGASDLEQIPFSEMLNILPAATNLRLIVVRSDDNVIDVYEKRRVQAVNSSDLLAVIRGQGGRV
jgi:hypothetical protein